MKKIVLLLLVLLFFVWSPLHADNYYPTIEFPQLSPDSRSIYFAAVLNEEADWQLFCMQADGTGLRLIDTPQLRPFFYSLSPDGKKIAFIAHKFEGYEGPHIYIINTDGTGLRDLGLKEIAQNTPLWTTDGQRIIFSGSFGTDQGEYLLSIKQDGSDLKQLTKFGAAAISLDKNGELLFFGNKTVKYLLGRGVKYELMQIKENGTGLRDYFKPEDAYWLRNISPDGEKLLFSKAENNNQLGFWVSDKKRNNRKRISAGKDNEVTTDNSPSWSSDSSRIVYTKGNYGEVRSIWLMNSDGTDNREVARFEKYLTARARVIISASKKKKEYVNEKYGFKFNYPEDWVVDPSTGEISGIKPLNWEEHGEKSIFDVGDQAISIRVIQGDLDVAAQEAGFEKMKDLRASGFGGFPSAEGTPDEAWMIMGRQCYDQVTPIHTDYAHGLQGDSLYGSFTKDGKHGGMMPFYVTILTKDNKYCLIISWAVFEDDDAVGEVYNEVIKSLKFSP